MNVVITAPADGIADKGARSSTHTVQTGEIIMLYIKLQWLPSVPYDLWGLDDVIQNGRRDLKNCHRLRILNSRHASSVLTLLMLETEYSGLFGQHHACWCPGSSSRQGTSRHGIGIIVKAICRLAPVWIFMLNKIQDMIRNVNTP